MFATSYALFIPALDDVLAEIKSIKGFKNVLRVVCGGCLDFKVVIALNAAEFGPWGMLLYQYVLFLLKSPQIHLFAIFCLVAFSLLLINFNLILIL